MINYSFIIPHHNSPDLLRRCLDSIPQRDDIEIIVADDNSDEDKRPSIDRGDVQLITITKEETKGAGHARNVAMTRATGKWLLFADCDDFYEGGFLDVLDEYKDSSYDIIYFDVYYGYNVITGTAPQSPLSNKIQRFLESPNDKVAEQNMKHASNTPWWKMFRREYINKIDVKFHEVPVCNDAWFSHYASIHTSNVYALPVKLYYYVNNDKSLTHKIHFEIEKERIKENAKIRKLLCQNGLKRLNRPFLHDTNKYCLQLGFWKTAILLLFKLKSYII